MVLKKQFKNICKKYFFQDYLVIEKLIAINFKIIDNPIIDCFDSDDLNVFTNINSSYTNDDIQTLFSKLITTYEENSQIDIKQINSIEYSKSKYNYSFDSIYLFGRDVYVDRDCKWTFEECIKHIMIKKDILDISYYAWNNKYTWHNSDASHHFAVASFLARNEKIEHEFNCNLTINKIDEEIAKNLLNTFDMFVIHQECRFELNDCFDENILMYDISHTTNTLVLFEKNKSLDKYIKILQKIDEKYILNLNAYLEERIKNQDR